MKNKILSIAEAEVGYLEKASNRQLDSKTANAGSANYTKYGRDYGMNGVAWCAMFVWWCANQAGIGADVIPKTASCTTSRNWFKDNGLFRSVAPQRGDLIYFKDTDGTAAHIGIVCAVDGSKVYTIEGNTSGGSTLISNGGGVCKKSYSLTYNKIQGYARPAYKTIEEEDPVTYEQWKEFQAKYEAEQEAKLVSGWATEYWNKATSSGLFDGTKPQAPLSREQAAKVLICAGAIK